jgi:4-diphosphocytidyl-2-C-methyl-D-erythritol kinase
MATALERFSPCKVNLLLNILGKRSDGFHELETVLQPLNLHDVLRFERRKQGGADLTCSDPALPTDATNLVLRAANAFFAESQIKEGVRVHLEKCIPLAAGLGGGSANAATTLLALNELFERPLPDDKLQTLATSLGSDVPFFLQSKPAWATGRGEQIHPLESFPALRGAAFLLIYPGFGISTVWAYRELSRFPSALNGQPGRAQKLIRLLATSDLAHAATEFYNALEAPALEKFPLLELYQEFLRANGAAAVLISGSGSTTFALTSNSADAEALATSFQQKFGPCWTAVILA